MNEHILVSEEWKEIPGPMPATSSLTEIRGFSSNKLIEIAESLLQKFTFTF